ncbi:tRNA1(Val) (adenine(37)-N6)-methyltransferase [Aeromonas hydrophila]|uniref:tRNA1(Val) (adenine(37)-N6)-methyltransferase n=1 Tax=Aeromonas hydrophila subsp. hydrophila (strain ATCC 7966 / DSM 30187 / BCRC 13018 / CCUG 14551 / JCM 1027 / KCTC 2358 / NCIMB 9240 / NCTC 8049) TaxID=380703 RepID=TRMN6_AERHH|nr:tRNA1(Val) (adenine(37)-N6)-methyltransferase [Aeromonas hydrophila]A0KPC4.1 RecName: Full=tRNA1(Val) (adenine(37)-N6)-methyltransferase; AltName: Full=tRNA m6A37 methyltransferase [Aeromonas hydrophila subsp. hydrophila ATCC 7966]ABK36818.1 SmtA protein [Aeromonas hydrophila subsp. hydrophila ATCC 7966]MBS4672637.1 tRNA1(Val) (adenine(37)-N6)-methyltransferase [Aeromonas hydrophila]OOD32693.1 tRNA (adenosine(37)-N6)-methyltransferase TrmM [Aeromonas hydrophila]SUU32282.1 SmtA protein [Aero
MGRNSGFTFKQFHVDHDRCAMKVGTDGILLGAWAPVTNARRVLDIGSGSGLIALMLAQRSPADCRIDAVELDSNAARQARENAAASPWHERVTVIESAIQTYQATPYDLIVSNPPYFVAGQSFRDPARALARHTGGLDSRDLLAACDRLLAPNGEVALVVPTAMADEILCISADYDLHAVCYTAVITRAGKEANRVLLRLGRGLNKCEQGEIVIHSADGTYSDRYIQLTSPFYLKM